MSGDDGTLGLGPFRLDRSGRTLTRDGVAVPLGGRAFDTLAALAAANGATVSKDQLLDAVWPGVTVEENNLQVQISALRKVLGEGWIVTEPGRGYRFVVLPAAAPPAPALPDKPSLVVLPFQNLSGDPEQDYFADGMVEEITTALSRIGNLFVIARNSAFTYKGRAVDVRDVGRDLGVRYVVEGSVRRSASNVRIACQLVEAATAANLWADRFDGALDDIFALQDRVAEAIAGAVEPSLRSAEIARASRKPTASLTAYDLMLRSLPLSWSLTPDSMREASRLLRAATELDPTFAPAFARLSISLLTPIIQGWKMPTEADREEILRCARTAVALDDDDPETLALTGLAIGGSGHDVAGALALTERALALNPVSATALIIAGFLYTLAHKFDLAIELVERAARLNPMEGGYWRSNTISLAHFLAGRYEESIAFAWKSLHDNPAAVAPLRRLAAALGILGRLDEARAAGLRLLALAPNQTVSLMRAYLEFQAPELTRRTPYIETFCEGLRRAGIPE